MNAVTPRQQVEEFGVTDRAFAKLLGQEIRRAREARGWTRAQLVVRLPSGIGERTLLSYEHGIRYMTVVRLREICRGLGIAVWEIMQRVSEKVDHLLHYSFKVTLSAVVRDQQEEFSSVRQWAETRLHNGSDEVLLSPATIRELAVALGVTHEQLAVYLVGFSHPAPNEPIT